MANELGNLSSETARTRRNILKMGGIAVPATLAAVSKASAGQGPICTFLGIFGIQCPPGGGGRGNCFLRGTKILTAEGDRNIEDLAVGDLLPTVFGGLRPVQWIGRYSRKKSDPSKAWAAEALPVRVARSALGPNVPGADLVVTAHHCFLIEGALVPAEMLINGTTVTRFEADGDELEFFHVKLESHDVVYAEGAPVETLLYADESFVNFVDYLRRHGMPATPEDRCAPAVPLGGRSELMSRARSALSPWIDLRNRADIVRDRVEEGAYSLV